MRFPLSFIKFITGSKVAGMTPYQKYNIHISLPEHVGLCTFTVIILRCLICPNKWH